jgi:hypothetical protein
MDREILHTMAHPKFESKLDHTSPGKLLQEVFSRWEVSHSGSDMTEL